MRASFGVVAALLACLACSGRDAARPAPPVEETPAPAPPAPPPAPRLAVDPRALAFDAVGDTLRLALEPGAACRSASVTVAAVDTFGLVRAVGNGETHLRCWRGRSQAVVRVRVEQEVARVGIVSDGGLALENAGDSVHLRLRAVDRLGSAVSVGLAKWTSLQPEVVQVDSATGTVLGVADSGAARIVASVDKYADTVTVEVGRKAPVATVTRAVTRTTPALARQAALRAARQPTATPARTGGAGGTPGAPGSRQPGAPLIGAREILPSDSLAFVEPLAQAAPRGWAISPSVRILFADHGVIQSGALERNGGVLFGAGADVSGLGLLRLGIALATGNLTAQTDAARDQKVTLGRLDVGVAPSSWLTLGLGVESRLYSGLGDVRWVIVRAGGQARLNFGDTPLTGVVGLQLLPVVSRGAGNTSPSFGINTTVGVSLERGRLTSSLRYVAERYSFPSGFDRTEQFSGLEIRFGLATNR